MSEEEWRPISDWPEYAISSLGRVKRIGATNHHWAHVGETRKLRKTPAGYPFVTLTKPGKIRKSFYIHRLVAVAFLPHQTQEWKLTTRTPTELIRQSRTLSG